MAEATKSNYSKNVVVKKKRKIKKRTLRKSKLRKQTRSKRRRKACKSKKCRKRKYSKSKKCPAGVGPMSGNACSVSKMKTIKSIVGSKQARCYGVLFTAEAGCKHNIYHDKKKAHNPHAGWGLCALEKSPRIRRQNKRGKVCQNISSFAQQIKCCRSIMRKHGSAYFGTIRCKKARRCY